MIRAPTKTIWSEVASDFWAARRSMVGLFVPKQPRLSKIKRLTSDSQPYLSDLAAQASSQILFHDKQAGCLFYISNTIPRIESGSRVISLVRDSISSNGTRCVVSISTGIFPSDTHLRQSSRFDFVFQRTKTSP